MERAERIDELIESLIRSGKKYLVVDISQVTYVDAAVSPFELLMRQRERLRSAGCSLAVVCADDSIARVFEITGLDRVFSIHSSIDEALGANARSSR